MNYKNTLCCLAISLLTASLSADITNEQMHRDKQVAAMTEQLHAIAEKIIKQEELVRKYCTLLDIRKQECISLIKIKSNNSDDQIIETELAERADSFFCSFLKDHKKNLMVDEFVRNFNTPYNFEAFTKFYMVHIFYERLTLIQLINQWDELAQQINTLLDQTQSSKC